MSWRVCGREGDRKRGRGRGHAVEREIARTYVTHVHDLCTTHTHTHTIFAEAKLNTVSQAGPHTRMHVRDRRAIRQAIRQAGRQVRRHFIKEERRQPVRQKPITKTKKY